VASGLKSILRDPGALLHALGGAAFGAALTALSPYLALLSVLVAGGFGVWRERRQHRDDVPVMTPHRWIEGLAWGAGALVGALLVKFLR
jgi:hypothetical protein